MTTESTSPYHCQITYAALRAAFVTTLDSLLRYSLDPESTFGRALGFMSCFPMLNGIAPQIQMECLFNTWGRLQQNQSEAMNLLDELVLYGAYEALAQLAVDKPGASLKMVMNAPDQVGEAPDHWLYSKTRCLQAAGPTAAGPHFLRELSKIEDPGPWFDAGSPANWCEKREELLDLVERWVARKNVLLNTNGLLTDDEKDILRAFFEEHPGLVR